MQSLDLAAEIVNLAKTTDVEVSGLAGQIPMETARYHLFWYKHTHEGDYTESAGWSRSTRQASGRIIYLTSAVFFISSGFVF